MHLNFYEKPGCINNTKQKALLSSCGHTLSTFSILTEPWTAESLRPFFGAMEIKDWFNPSAPVIKQGLFDPALQDEQSAQEAMLSDRLLIRRPLIATDTEFACGFDNELVKRLTQTNDLAGLQHCPNSMDPCG